MIFSQAKTGGKSILTTRDSKSKGSEARACMCVCVRVSVLGVGKKVVHKGGRSAKLRENRA